MPAAPRPRAKPSRFDAIEMLKADHIAIKKLFIAFHQLSDRSNTDGERRAVAERICTELTVHGQIEEEIFYPAVRAAIGDDALVDQAEVEHASARELIAEISAMAPTDEQFDAKVIVLGKHIDAHVEEEHSKIFPKAKKAKVDLKAVGTRLASRKAKLMEEYHAMASGGEPHEDENADPVGRPLFEHGHRPASRA
jgi:hemerythrin superfamily protein